MKKKYQPFIIIRIFSEQKTQKGFNIVFFVLFFSVAHQSTASLAFSVQRLLLPRDMVNGENTKYEEDKGFVSTVTSTHLKIYSASEITAKTEIHTKQKQTAM